MKPLLRMILNLRYRIRHRFFPYRWVIKDRVTPHMIHGQVMQGIETELFSPRGTRAGWVWLTTGSYYHQQQAPYAMIHSLAVSVRFRRMGIATLVLKHAIEQARAKGFDELFLLTEPDNLPAMRLYQQLGFAPCHKGMHCDAYEKEIALITKNHLIGLFIYL